jgi:hypothetical protein
MFGFKYQGAAFVIKNPDFDDDISTLLWEYMVWSKRQTLEAVQKRVKTHVYGEINAPDQIAKIIQEEYSRTAVQYAKVKGCVESSY